MACRDGIIVDRVLNFRPFFWRLISISTAATDVI